MECNKIVLKLWLKIIIFAYLIVTVLGTTTKGNCQPIITSVSGSLNNGTQLSISGSGFGLHSDYDSQDQNKLNYGWHDFEAGTTFRDATINGDGFAPDCNNSDCHNDWLLMNTGNKTNSKYWGKRIDLHDSFACNVDGLKKPYGGSANYGNISFVSFWFKIPHTASSGKFYRQWSNGGNSSLFWLATGGSDYYLRGSDDIDVIWTSPSQFLDSTWQRVDILSTGSNVKVSIVGQNNNNVQWNKTWSTNSDGSFQAVIGSGKDYGQASNDYYGYDDIYIDFTQARIELCNTSTWSSRTHCEIQIPQSWNSSTIQAKINLGSFENGSNVYLYVVDQNGNVNSSGYALTVSGGATNQAPSAPQGLQIN